MKLNFKILIFIFLTFRNIISLDTDSYLDINPHIVYAIAQNNISKVKDYIEEKPDNINFEHMGYYLLNMACEYNRFDIAKLLIDHGADINKADRYGKTPLIYAATKDKNQGHEILDFLISKGVKLNHLDIALLKAIEQNHISIAKILINNGADAKKRYNYHGTHNTTLLMVAAANHKANDVLDILIKEGIEVNTTDANGETALFYAIKSAEVHNVDILLQNGAYVLHNNNDGLNCIDILTKTHENHLKNYQLTKDKVYLNIVDNCKKIALLIYAKIKIKRIKTKIELTRLNDKLGQQHIQSKL